MHVHAGLHLEIQGAQLVYFLKYGGGKNSISGVRIRLPPTIPPQPTTALPQVRCMYIMYRLLYTCNMRGRGLSWLCRLGAWNIQQSAHEKV